MNGLHKRAWLGLIVVTAIMGLVIFLCAGTVQYWQGWAYLGIYCGASISITLYLMKRDPALLERRLRGGPAAEKEKKQKVIMVFASLGFVASLVVPAIDHRLMWSSVPYYGVAAGYLLTVLCFSVIFLVFKENTFSSAIIETVEGQKVITTGPYACVRHPMYAGASLLFIGTPLALGSYWGLLAFAAVLPALIWRLLDEEKFLEQNLPGYREYCRKVRWRLVPGVF